MKYNKAYSHTIESYKKMGKKYLSIISPLVSKHIYFFMETLNPGGKVLDVGCAGGRDAKVLVDKGFDTVGIDLVDEFLEEARKNVPKASFLKMDLLDIKFPKNSFDGIWASAVLLHIQREDMPKVLEKFCEILKPGGKIFIGVKLGNGYTFETDKLSTKKRLMVLFSEKEMKKMVDDAGLNIIYFEVVPSSTREDIKHIRLIAEK